jgi:hypothetical protein
VPRSLLVTPRWNLEEDYGGEVSVRLLREGLQDAGWTVHVATGETDAGGADVTETDLSTRALGGVIREVEPDVVHSYNMSVVQPTLLASKLMRTPAVATANSYWATCLWADMTFPDGELCPGCSLSGLSRDFANRDPETVGRRVPTPLARAEVARRTALLRGFDRIVTLSEASRRRMSEGGIPREDMTVVPNMVEPRDRAAELPELVTDPEILFVGQLKHTKGVGILLEAMPAVLDEVPQARLRVAGTGPQRDELEGRASELGVEDAVEFLGYVDPVDLREVYRSSRIVAMPTVWIEPFGRVVLEAWAHGPVLVASDRGGPAEVAEDGETARIVPARDAEALAGAIVEVLEDDELARRLRESGKQRLERFRPERVVSAYEDVYDHVAEG